MLIGFWLLCAVAAAVIAASKGHSGLDLLFGFLLGPIGFGQQPGNLPSLHVENSCNGDDRPARCTDIEIKDLFGALEEATGFEKRGR